ncbi:MAG: hypothetical protein M1282_04335 [Chloroflexi bacterium]|nr:hypothetical protein [Chloroflexota bacterium]
MKKNQVTLSSNDVQLELANFINIANSLTASKNLTCLPLAQFVNMVYAYKNSSSSKGKEDVTPIHSSLLLDKIPTT